MQLPPQLKLQPYFVGWNPDGQPSPHFVMELQPLHEVHADAHWQELLQLFDIQVPGQPEVDLLPGLQTPPPLQPLHPFHWQPEWQLRLWVPQFPQPCDWVCPGLQVPSPVQP